MIRNFSIGRIFIGFTIVALFFVSCAKIGTPNGGPKDEAAPFVVKSKPVSYSTNIHPRKIELQFNEFVVLKNERTEFVVSPYIDELIVPRIVGKSIVIDLRTVKFDSNQTYTFNFGNSVFDNNENNPLPNLEFVFSTKDYIDTMSVKGRILDAFNLLPDKDGLFVVLYRNTHDTIPLTTKPDYITRTNKEGNFMLNNVANGTYKVFALKDGNNNYKYDLADETIAFADSLLVLKPYEGYIPVPPELDTAWLTSDSIGISIDDTERIDSILATLPITDSVKSFVNDYFVDMLSFTKIVPRQNLSKYQLNDETSILIEFDEIITDTPSVELLFPEIITNWYLNEHEDESKSMTLWITDTLVGKSDSIALAVTYKKLDSNEVLVPFYDTLIFRKQKQDEGRPRRGGGSGKLFSRNKEDQKADTIAKDTVIIPKVGVKNNIANKNTFDLDKPLILSLPTPIASVDFSRIEMSYIDDTTERKTTYEYDNEPDMLRQVSIHKKWEEYTRYKVFIPEGTFTDIYGAINDTTIINFTTQRADYYGLIRLHTRGVFDQTIVQLLTEKEVLVKEMYITSDTTLIFEYLEPSKYVIKAIIDRNNNGKWDSGDYERKRQPESVFYYPREVNVRANWELESQWEIKDY